MISTLASNRKYGRVNDLELDSQRLSITGRALSESAGLERKSVPPPPDAGTKARAFNAADMLPSNLTVTGSVIGERAPVKSPLFLALSSRLEKSTYWHSTAGVISHQDTPRDVKVSAPA